MILFWPALLAAMGRAGAAIGIRGLGAEAAATVGKTATQAAARPIVEGGFFNTLRSGMRSATQLFGDVRKDGFDLALAKRMVPAQHFDGQVPGRNRERILREAFPQQMESRDRAEAAQHIDFGSLMGQMGNPNAANDAMAQAKLDAASARAEQESIKREQQAAKAAQELAESFGGVSRALGFGVGTAVAGYVALKKIGDFAEANGERLSPYSSSIMRESVRLDVQRLRQDINEAQVTSASASMLMRATYNFREVTKPIENLAANTYNVVGAGLVNASAWALRWTTPWVTAGQIAEKITGSNKKQMLGMDVMFRELIGGQKRDGRGTFHADGKPLQPPPNWNRNPF